MGPLHMLFKSCQIEWWREAGSGDKTITSCKENSTCTKYINLFFLNPNLFKCDYQTLCFLTIQFYSDTSRVNKSTVIFIVIINIILLVFFSEQSWMSTHLPLSLAFQNTNKANTHTSCNLSNICPRFRSVAVVFALPKFRFYQSGEVALKRGSSEPRHLR